MMGPHTTTILEDRLFISYEAENKEFDEPESAVLLYSRCCEMNHDHIQLTKMDAVKLAHWLHCFIEGEYDE
jgi:hypothetical protein